jgi:hypothetical protein
MQQQLFHNALHPLQDPPATSTMPPRGGPPPAQPQPMKKRRTDDGRGGPGAGDGGVSGGGGGRAASGAAAGPSGAKAGARELFPASAVRLAWAPGRKTVSVWSFLPGCGDQWMAGGGAVGAGFFVRTLNFCTASAADRTRHPTPPTTPPIRFSLHNNRAPACSTWATRAS